MGASGIKVVGLGVAGFSSPVIIITLHLFRRHMTNTGRYTGTEYVHSNNPGTHNSTIPLLHGCYVAVTALFPQSIPLSL